MADDLMAVLRRLGEVHDAVLRVERLQVAQGLAIEAIAEALIAEEQVDVPSVDLDGAPAGAMREPGSPL